jgi:hypothetical protein
LNLLSSWSCLLPLMFGVVWLFFLSKESRIVLLIVLFASVPQMLHVLNVKNETLKLLAYNLYTPAEFLLFFSIFYRHVENSKNLLLLKATFMAYVTLSIFFIVHFNITKDFISEWAILNNICYTAWILIIFFEQYAYTNSKSLDFHDPFFWYVMGLLFYAPCTAMIFSMWNFIQKDNNSLLKMIHEIFNINMYILFAIGFLKEYRLNKSYPI